VIAAQVAGDICHDSQADPDPVKTVEWEDDLGPVKSRTNGMAMPSLSPLSSFKVRWIRTGMCSFVKMGNPGLHPSAPGWPQGAGQIQPFPQEEQIERHVEVVVNPDGSLTVSRVERPSATDLSVMYAS